MADNLPINFPLPADSSIASYDFDDIATGRAYKILYGMGLLINNAFGRVLSTQTYFSFMDDDDDYSQTDSGANTALDIDFDIILGNRTVNGDLIIQMPISLKRNGGAASMGSVIAVKFYRVRSGVETQIGTTITHNIQEDNAYDNHTFWHMFSGKTTIVNEVFKADDILRLNITTVAAGLNNSVIIHHDPTNSFTGTSAIGDVNYSTQLKVLVPFDID